ncbi:hypothetical protein [Butyrivibrio sp. INlla16]|uniref:hypothetical protein n=1 Tax=Butyrivibrio sp. INlla16 TaxID=1520807 RepID=UPI000B84C3BC|nr:hypothetical protein [Butyrivibrio sp. INlla16]
MEDHQLWSTCLPSINGASSDGTVYIYENGKDGIEVGFWEFRGMLSGSRIVMYINGRNCNHVDLLSFLQKIPPASSKVSGTQNMFIYLL